MSTNPTKTFFVIDAGSSSYKLTLINIYECDGGLKLFKRKKVKYEDKLATADIPKIKPSFKKNLNNYLDANGIQRNQEFTVVLGGTAGFRKISQAKQKSQLDQINDIVKELQTESFNNMVVGAMKVLSPYSEGIYAYLAINYRAFLNNNLLRRVYEVGGASAQIAIEDHLCLEPDDAGKFNSNDKCFELKSKKTTRGVRVSIFEDGGSNRNKEVDYIAEACPVNGKNNLEKYNDNTYEKCKAAATKLMKNSLKGREDVLPILSNVNTSILGSPVYSFKKFSGLQPQERSSLEERDICDNTPTLEVGMESKWITNDFIANLKAECKAPTKPEHDFCYQGIFNTAFFNHTKSLHENHIFVLEDDVSWEDGMVLDSGKFIETTMIELDEKNFKKSVQLVSGEKEEPKLGYHHYIYFSIGVSIVIMLVIILILIAKIKKQTIRSDV